MNISTKAYLTGNSTVSLSDIPRGVYSTMNFTVISYTLYVYQREHGLHDGSIMRSLSRNIADFMMVVYCTVDGDVTYRSLNNRIEIWLNITIHDKI